MLVKQWLREFLARNTQNPKEQVKIRTYRHAGVKGWHVFELAAFLPLLLQLALLLFFIGLSEFLRKLDPVVGWITTSVVLAWLVVFLFTTFAPLIYSTCPYKTPILRPLFSGTRKTLYFLISKACHYLMLRVDLTALPPTITHKAWLLLASWVERTRQSEELGACRQWSDLAILVSSVDHLRGERLEDTIIQCSRNYTEDQARLCVDFMARHLGQPQTSPNWLPPSGHHLTISKVCVKMLNTEDGLFWVLIASRSFLPAFQALHQCIASAASNTWEHSDIEVSRSAFRRLTHRNPNTAVLALLSVYRTIRERIIDLTAVNDPQSFHWVCHPQNDAVGKQHLHYDFGWTSLKLPSIAGGIIVNLVEATRTLLQIVWDDFIDPHDSVHDCIDQARVLNPSTLQKDAIVMISAFAAFCWLASPTDVQHHADILNETLEELANILEAQDLESINDMHAYCLENACRTLAKLGLTNTRITNRMENIVTNRPLPVIQFHLP